MCPERSQGACPEWFNPTHNNLLLGPVAGLPRRYLDTFSHLSPDLL